MKLTLGRYRHLVIAIALSNLVSVVLFFFRAVGAENFRYWFLFWNLLLAWVPLALAWLLTKDLRIERWKSGSNILLTVLWLLFLPNSFYIVSDLIHLHLTGEVSILYDAALFTSVIFNGYVFGFMSVYIVHRELLKRLKAKHAHIIIAGVFFLSSFAIYLGRYLRWNTWDVLLHPIGLLFDVSDRFINPTSHPQAFSTTVIFFLMLGSMYMVLYELARLIRSKQP